MDKPTGKLLIAFTPEHEVPGEAQAITEILRAGFDLVHLRHPGASLRDIKRIIEDVPQPLRCRLVLHGHFELIHEFNLGGLHLNSRCPSAPAGYAGPVSRSCHTVDEVRRYAPECRYVTLSPIFPSISKPGYRGTFTSEELLSLPADKVVALGGVTPERFAELERYPFVGYALLGALWS